MNNFWEIQIEKTYFRCQSLFLLGTTRIEKKLTGHYGYHVNIYYVVFRLLFNIITNRGLLINWYRQLLYWGAISVISFFTYDKLIKLKANILPNFTTVANELWIIILIFIFQLTNNIRLSQDGTIKRKQNYLKSRLQPPQNYKSRRKS